MRLQMQVTVQALARAVWTLSMNGWHGNWAHHSVVATAAASPRERVEVEVEVGVEEEVGW